MMFNNKLVACIKSNGKVLREFKDVIYIPFGSEYSIYLKNLNSVRAEVNISIDGKDVCPDGLVINANSEVNIERFIKDLNTGNRFKFIERTGNIENHRGIQAEDGLIRISFKFEKVMLKPTWVNVLPVYSPTYIPQPGHWEWKPSSPLWTGPLFNTYAYGIRSGDAIGNSSSTTGAVGNAVNCSTSTTAPCGESVPQNGTLQASKGILRSASFNSAGGQSQPSVNTVFSQQAITNDVGITVAGSESNQKFQTVSSFVTEDEEFVMVLRLLGETEAGKEVVQPVTVKLKPKCVTCGRNNKATAKFCVECGTALSII